MNWSRNRECDCWFWASTFPAGVWYLAQGFRYYFLLTIFFWGFFFFSTCCPSSFSWFGWSRWCVVAGCLFFFLTLIRTEMYTIKKWKKIRHFWQIKINSFGICVLMVIKITAPEETNSIDCSSEKWNFWRTLMARLIIFLKDGLTLF